MRSSDSSMPAAAEQETITRNHGSQPFEGRISTGFPTRTTAGF
jgi:hypothetical protein